MFLIITSPFRSPRDQTTFIIGLLSNSSSNSMINKFAWAYNSSYTYRICFVLLQLFIASFERLSVCLYTGMMVASFLHFNVNKLLIRDNEEWAAHSLHLSPDRCRWHREPFRSQFHLRRTLDTCPRQHRNRGFGRNQRAKANRQSMHRAALTANRMAQWLWRRPTMNTVLSAVWSLDVKFQVNDSDIRDRSWSWNNVARSSNTNSEYGIHSKNFQDLC